MNISHVVDNNLCHGCGACYAVCPNNCITIQLGNQGIYKPVVNDKNCVDCGICLDVCSGYSINYDQMISKLYGAMPVNRYTGVHDKLYIGASTDEEIFHKGSSGGMITAILLYLLEKKTIDGAIVAQSNRENPILTETVIARTKEEIFQAAGSRYNPTHTNTILRDIIHSKNNEKYIYVGLPCQIASLRKMEEKFSILKQKIVLCISLFCGRMSSVYGIEYILNRYKIKKKNIKRISFREGNWPGNLLINTSKSSYRIPFFQYYGMYFMRGFFTPYRCLLCNDFHGDLADLACGDAWLDKYKKNKIGKNLMIARTKYASDILLDMHTNKRIKLLKATEEMFLEAFSKGGYFNKKDSLLNRMKKYKRLRLPIPDITDSTLLKTGNNKKDYTNLIHSKLFNNKRFAKIGHFVPNIGLKIYYKLLDQILTKR